MLRNQRIGMMKRTGSGILLEFEMTSIQENGYLDEYETLCIKGNGLILSSPILTIRRMILYIIASI